MMKITTVEILCPSLLLRQPFMDTVFDHNLYNVTEIISFNYFLDYSTYLPPVQLICTTAIYKKSNLQANKFSVVYNK